MKGYAVTRRFRGAVYHIRVENPNGAEQGVKELYLDGKRLESGPIPVQEAGAEVDVRVVMG